MVPRLTEAYSNLPEDDRLHSFAHEKSQYKDYEYYHVGCSVHFTKYVMFLVILLNCVAVVVVHIFG